MFPDEDDMNSDQRRLELRSFEGKSDANDTKICDYRQLWIWRDINFSI